MAGVFDAVAALVVVQIVGLAVGDHQQQRRLRACAARSAEQWRIAAPSLV